ncbi:hypothetical protein AB0J37_33375 [Microbispora rosea]|uniref:hypothetical protein n=1 Tax=Microbispora rosea TaxID=58117 RepID=UPI00343A88FB
MSSTAVRDTTRTSPTASGPATARWAVIASARSGTDLLRVTRVAAHAAAVGTLTRAKAAYGTPAQPVSLGTRVRAAPSH